MALSFPTILSALDATTATRFKEAAERLEAYVAVGAVPNPAFAPIKSNLNRGIERAWEALVQKPFFWGKGGTSDFPPDDVSKVERPELHIYRSSAKKLAAVKSKHPAIAPMKAIMDEVGPLVSLVDQAKDMLVKRQPKAPEDVKSKYQAPSTTQTGMRTVYDLLVSVTESEKEALTELFKTRYTKMLDRYFELTARAVEEGKKFPSPYTVFRDYRSTNMNMECYQVVEECVETKDYREGSTYTRRSDAEERITKMAERTAQEVRENFVVKNLSKLDSIIERKQSEMTVAKVIGRGLSRQGLEGKLRFDFADGSGFTVRNSVVFAHSMHGTPFLRYPLTFHNVTLPGGDPMKNPSEEKMNTEFVGHEPITV